MCCKKWQMFCARLALVAVYFDVFRLLHTTRRVDVGSYVGLPDRHDNSGSARWRMASARTPVLVNAVLLPQTETQHFLVKRAAAQKAAAELIQCVPCSGKMLPLILFCL